MLSRLRFLDSKWRRPCSKECRRDFRHVLKSDWWWPCCISLLSENWRRTMTIDGNSSRFTSARNFVVGPSVADSANSTHGYFSLVQKANGIAKKKILSFSNQRTDRPLTNSKLLAGRWHSLDIDEQRLKFHRFVRAERCAVQVLKKKRKRSFLNLLKNVFYFLSFTCSMIGAVVAFGIMFWTAPIRTKRAGRVCSSTATRIW